MKRGFILILLLTVTLQAHAVEVTDFLGRKVVLIEPAKRVIALAPHIVENVYSAGAGDQLVGVVSYSNYPDAAQSIPIVGGYKSFSLEAILTLKPDLILMWASGNGMKALSQLEALDLAVYVDELHKLEQIATSIRDIGLLTGHHAEADANAAKFLEGLAQLRVRYDNSSSVSMFYQVWNEPLQTLNGEHIINDVIELCGGRNIFADAVVLAPKISLESVIVGNPDAIVASGMGEARPEWLDEWHSWPALSAVKNDHLFFVPPDILQRHTPRILLGARQLCGQLEQVRAAKTASMR
ncbi:MAG: cobalamin-binding protein [Pseudomonadota bacterium]